MRAPHLIPDLPVGRDRGCNGNDAVPLEQVGDKADPPDILIAVLLREPQALREVCPHHVSIQDLELVAAIAELLGQIVRDRRLARTGQPRKPEREALMHQFVFLLTPIH